MRNIDRILQKWRIRKAAEWIPDRARILDIGCHKGELFEILKDKIGPSIGIDPLAEPKIYPQYKILKSSFEGKFPFDDACFDIVTLLATVEHINYHDELIQECWRILNHKGRVIITVPSPLVDEIVNFLVRLNIADGMSMEEHFGFNPIKLPSIFCRYGFIEEHWSRFQCGLNHLMVFQKKSDGH